MSNFRLPYSKIADWIARVTCRYVPYSVAVAFIKTLLRTPLGKRHARRRCAALFFILDEQRIDYEPAETAIQHMMMVWLFPWAYCRFNQCPRKEFDRWINITGLENLTPLLNEGRGILLLLSHFGLYHAGSMVLRAQGHTVYTLRAKNRFQTRYGLDSGDLLFPQELYVTHDKSPGRIKTTRTIYDVLRRGGIVASALDVGGKRRVLDTRPTLMGYQIPFNAGLPVIAARAGAGIVQYFGKLNADGSVEVHFNPPLPDFLNDRPPLEFAEEIVRHYAYGLQGFLEDQPSHLRPERIMSWQKR